MIAPAEPHRDEYGYWTHPALAGSGCETSVQLHAWLKDHRLRCDVMIMRDEAPEILAACPTGQVPDARNWQPQPPDDDDWFLGSVHASDYGPVCYWFCAY